MIRLEYDAEKDTVTATAKGSYNAVITEICLLIMSICKMNDVPPRKMLKDIKVLLSSKPETEYIRRLLCSSSQEHDIRHSDEFHTVVEG